MDAVLDIIALQTPLCPPPKFGPPACTDSFFGVVDGGACLCPPGKFGVDCGIMALPDASLSLLNPVVFRSDEAATVFGPSGDGLSVPAGAILKDVAILFDVYSIVPEPGTNQVNRAGLSNTGLICH